MQRKFLFFITSFAFIFYINTGCTKIDTTLLGADLLPAVDNISTFADTLTIIGSRGVNIDTTKLNRSETHVLGAITNDPIFGKTKADIFLQLKPSFFPYFFGNVLDTINPMQKASTHFDSAFLCLSYTGFYGDSTKAQQFKVYQLDENTGNFVDTAAYMLSFKPDKPYLGNLIGQATIYQPDLKNFIYFNNSKKDSVTKQIRIKLSNAFLQSFATRDSGFNKPNNAFYNDTTFLNKYKGFAVVSNNGNGANGLFYVKLTDAATRLEVHYVASNAGKLDTAFSSFPLSLGSLSTLSASANANAITRDTASSEFTTAPNPNALYIQSAPGSAINLSIPALSTLTNRIIHRAEIILEQIPGTFGNDIFAAPQYLYLDLIDDTSAIKKYKPIYYDLSPNAPYYPDNTTSSSFFPAAGIDYSYFGGFLRNTTDALGTRSFYSFNVTRYVQNVITKGGINYKMRVYAPYNLNYNGYNLTYKNNLAFGRVKIGNGNNANYKLRMRIVYSKL